LSGQELQVLSDINGRLGRLEGAQEANAKANGELAGAVNRLVDKLDRSDDLAREADQRARSAHHRLDRLDKLVFWAGTTIIGALFVGAVTLLYKNQGG